MGRRTGQLQLMRLLNVTGACLLIASVVYPILRPGGSSAAAMIAIGIAAALWLVAYLLPAAREREQAWARSAQVAFVLMALGQASAVALNERAGRLTERRNVRADSLAAWRAYRSDSLAERRANRSDSVAEARAIWQDSVVVARAARLDSIQRATARFHEVAEAQRRSQIISSVDREITLRLARLQDSLAACGALEIRPKRREAWFYERAWSALNRYMAPRNAMADGLESVSTHELVRRLCGLDGSSDLRIVLRHLEAAAGNGPATSSMGVQNSWHEPDTMMVRLQRPYVPTVELMPVASFLEVLELPRWRR